MNENLMEIKEATDQIIERQTLQNTKREENPNPTVGFYN